jgi:replication initiation and membrane attachment protein
MTFKSKNYTNYEIENEEIIKKEKSKLNYFYDFDFDLLISSMPKNLFNIKTLNKINKELIRDLVFLYELDPYSMSELVKSSLNESGMIDKEELRKNVRKYYQYNNSNKLPSLIFKSQPDYLMSPKGDNSPRGKMIKVFETISPYKFLKSKNNGVKPSERDMKVLESLLVDFKLNPAVVNVLVDYTLRINNNKLTKNYIETIASQWKRLKIETAKEAMEQAEKEYKKYKKSSIKESIKKKDVLPSWFNKEIKKEELTEEERREFEELVKEFK